MTFNDMLRTVVFGVTFNDVTKDDDFYTTTSRFEIGFLPGT